MKLELTYATTFRICDTCGGTGGSPSVSTQLSRIPKSDAAGWRSMKESKAMNLAVDEAVAASEAALCDQCAGAGEVRVERVAALSLEASVISLGIASCAAGYTGKPLLIGMFLALVLFGARMITFRTERYLLTKRHASKCISSSSARAGS